MPEGKITVAPRPLSRLVPTPIEAHWWSTPMRRRPSHNRLPAMAMLTRHSRVASRGWGHGWGERVVADPSQRPAAAAPFPTCDTLPRALPEPQGKPGAWLFRAGKQHLEQHPLIDLTAWMAQISYCKTANQNHRPEQPAPRSLHPSRNYFISISLSSRMFTQQQVSDKEFLAP